MKNTLAILVLLFSGLLSQAQDTLPLRNSKSYLIVKEGEKDSAYLDEKCRQAGLDMGIEVLANRIPTNSKLVSPQPSEHLLRHGALRLLLPLDEKDTEFAVYRSELFDQPATINVLLIDDELITYRSTEPSTLIHMFYNCTRGAFGTKKSAHSKNAVVYKLWDTPQRALLPDLEIQDQMAQKEAQRLAKTNYPLLIFNDLKSYAYNEYGDTAIGHFLDTMRKYNPDKLLQADLLTPNSQRYLSRVNENLPWNASMRTKIVETLTEKQEFFRKTQMTWMIGNFHVVAADKYQKATSLEELEWFLSKSAAFDAGFGLIFSAETMKKHGLTDEMLDAINIWEALRLSGAFSEAQKELFKDPYEDWHIEKAEDSSYLLYPQYVSRGYSCNFENDSWQWNTPYQGRFALRIEVEGKGSVSELELRTPNGILYFPCTVEAGQYLFYDFDGTAYITDLNFNKIQEVIPQGISRLDEGVSEVKFACEVKTEDKKQPEVTLRYITRGVPETINSPKSGLLRRASSQ